MTASPIMTLFREWEAKYAKAADMIATSDAESDDLLAQCREIELRMMQLPAGDTADFAAKMIVSTAYGGFALADAGTGGLVDEAVAILADRKGGASCA